MNFAPHPSQGKGKAQEKKSNFDPRIFCSFIGAVLGNKKKYLTKEEIYF